MPETALDQKSPDEEVTWAEVQEAHEDLKSEFNRELDGWWDEKEKYLREQGIGLPSDLEEQWDRMNEKVDELEAIFERKLDAYEEQNVDQRDEENKAYRHFLKNGEDIPAKEEKLLATDTDSDGGILLPRNRRDSILERARAMSPVRDLAQVRTISSGDSWEEPVEGSEMASGWVSERENRSETDSGSIELVKIPVHEQYAKPKATQKMLEDPAFDIVDYMDRKVSNKFMRQEGSAFVNGNGEGKPRGFLQVLTNGNHSNLVIPTGNASSLTYQGLLDLVYDIEEEEYEANAQLAFNRKTMSSIRGITDNNDRPIYDPGTPEEGPSVEGYPFQTMTDMPTVGSGTYPIVFGDFQTGYTIVDRLDITLLRDPYSDKPRVEFYFRRRVGGDLVLPETMRVQEVTT